MEQIGIEASTFTVTVNSENMAAQRLPFICVRKGCPEEKEIGGYAKDFKGKDKVCHLTVWKRKC